MRIVVASPLYPPDIAAPAPYVKELATRLSTGHEVTLVVYGRLPEPIPGVRIVSVPKDRPAPLRMIHFFFALVSAMRNADRVYVENGSSVELPAALASLMTGQRFVIHRGDPDAHVRAQKNGVRSFIERFAESRAVSVVEDAPLPRPEIMPLEAPPMESEVAYAASWKRHLEELAPLLSHAH